MGAGQCNMENPKTRVPTCNGGPGELQRLLDRTFIVALLLSGSVKRAEAAILEGIQLLDEAELSGETLPREVVRVSIQRQRRTSSSIQAREYSAPDLSMELLRVL